MELSGALEVFLQRERHVIHQDRALDHLCLMLGGVIRRDRRADADRVKDQGEFVRGLELGEQPLRLAFIIIWQR